MAITITTDLDYDQAAYERLAYFALRPQLYFDACADVKPTNQSMAGSSVIFTIHNDIAVASTAINQSTDVTPVTMSDSQVTVTLAEYGAAVTTTALVRGTSFVPLDPVVANTVGFNAGISIDTIARDVLKAGTNVRRDVAHLN
jgi:N4-gp56 family major capsid protein